MPDASRRALLAAGGIGAAALVAGAPPASAASAAASAAGRMPTRGSFAAVRGTVVKMRGPSGVVRAVVADIGDLAGARAGDPRRYSVILKPKRPLADGIYRVSSRKLRGTSLFFANVDRRPGARLQAVVSAAPRGGRVSVHSPHHRSGA